MNVLIHASSNRRLVLAFAATVLAAGLATRAQNIVLPRDMPPRLKRRKIVDKLPAAPSLPPAFSIPIESLGYRPPGPAYLGRHETLASLDFLDETRLLFSFPAQGLLHREADDAQSNDARQMQTVVVTLPDGKVESQATWTVPGMTRYLWMLKDGRFLLRDHEGLRIGNDKLETRPFIQLPGELLSLQIDPTQTVAVITSNAVNDPSSSKQPQGSPHTSAGTQKDSALSETVVRTVELSSGQIKLTQHLPTASQLPINSQGQLEITHDKFDQWSLRLNVFQGGSKILGHTQSNCQPVWSFISEREILVTGCNPDHGWKLDALATNGQQLWQTQIPAPFISPLLVMAPDGSRFARETIVLNEGVKPGPQTLWVKAVKGQVVRVFDAANGKIALEAPVSPTLDAGGNVAFSPSGRRVAVLNTDAIQVFELPPANR